MLFAAIPPIVAWFAFRQKSSKYALVAFLVVSAITPFLIDYDVRHGGIERYSVGPPHDTEYSIVYYNSTALFPFMIQKHHNWTSEMFVYQLRFLDHDGYLIYQTSALDDQSEWMHWTRFRLTMQLCALGISTSFVAIIFVELIRWLHKEKTI